MSNEQNRAAWDETMRRHAVAAEEYAAMLDRLAGLYGPDWPAKAPAEEQAPLDDACEAVSDRETELLKIPAPDLPALRWKLDLLLSPAMGGGDSVAAWAEELVAQTRADMARLLPPS